MIDFYGFDVVIMGESHDNASDHVNQADWVSRLSPKALVFEMLLPRQADLANAADRDDQGLKDLLDWEARGWPDFSMYQPIFQAAPKASIFGGDVTPADLRRSMTDGAAIAIGASATIFGLEAPLPRAEAGQRQAMQKAAHCDAIPDDMLPGMVEAQRLRDAALARAIVAALSTVGPPVAVITGNGHARTDWGIPVALRAAIPDVKALSIGQLEAPLTGDEPYDVVVMSTPPLDRGDPCEAFR